jgi:hypothetical protein
VSRSKASAVSSANFVGCATYHKSGTRPKDGNLGGQGIFISPFPRSVLSDYGLRALSEKISGIKSPLICQAPGATGSQNGNICHGHEECS